MTLPKITGNNPVPIQPNPGNNAPMEPPVPPQPGNVPPQSNRQGGAEAAQNLLRELDVLMMRAVERKNAAVEAKALKQDLQGLMISQQKRDEIEQAAIKAETAFKIINQFSGKDLADAVLLEMGAKGGKFVWAADSAVGKAVQTAMTAQTDLAGLLRSLAAKLPRGPVARRLEDAAFRCDLRISELSMLLIKFANLKAEAGLKGDNEPKIHARMEQLVKELLPHQEIKMHGNAGLPSTMLFAIKPLEERLQKLSEDPDAEVTAEELGCIQFEIGLMSNALDSVIQSEHDLGPDAHGRLGITQETNAKELLRGVRNKLANVRKSIGKASMRRFARRVLAAPRGNGIFQSHFQTMLKMVAPKLAHLVAKREQLAEASEKFIEEATDENAAKLRQAAAECAALDRYDVLEELKNLAECAEIVYLEDDNLGLKTEFDRLSAKQKAGITEQDLSAFGKALEELATSADAEDPEGAYLQLAGEILASNRLSSQVEHLIAMQKSINRMAEEKFLTVGSLRAVFEGKMQITTLIEARVNGMDDEDINPALDDSRMVSSKPLGQGNVNTVSEVCYNDGSKWVFKPEAEARKGFANAFLTHEGYRPVQQVSQLNMAVQKTADVLGLGDVMVKTSVGAHQGQYGMFMEKAPGSLGVDFANSDVDKGEGLDCRQIQELPDEQHAMVVGRLLRQANRLAWFDLLTGQGDRHNSNYMVQVKPDLTVFFKGIDNDASFPCYRTGLTTFQLKGVFAQRFEANLKVGEEMYPPSAREAQRKRLLTDPGVTKNADGSYTVDTSKFNAPELHYVLQYTVGQHTSLALPSAIDRDLYEHLKALKGGEARDKYIADLKARLSTEAVQAAIGRLDEAIAHADKLAAGKVFGGADWEKHEIQRSVVSPALKYQVKFDRVDGRSMGQNGRRLASQSAEELNAENVFIRDLARSIAKPGWF